MRIMKVLKNELSFAPSMEKKKKTAQYTLVIWTAGEKPNSHAMALEKRSISSILFLTVFETTYPWQLGYHNSHQSQKIDDEICQIVMRVVSAE
jgi:hypothetical protein